MTNAPSWKLYDNLVELVLLPRNAAFLAAGALLVAILILRLTAEWLQRQQRGSHLLRDQSEGADVW
jgi:hypothetical protein